MRLIENINIYIYIFKPPVTFTPKVGAFHVASWRWMYVEDLACVQKTWIHFVGKKSNFSISPKHRTFDAIYSSGLSFLLLCNAYPFIASLRGSWSVMGMDCVDILDRFKSSKVMWLRWNEPGLESEYLVQSGNIGTEYGHCVQAWKPSWEWSGLERFQGLI